MTVNEPWYAASITAIVLAIAYGLRLSCLHFRDYLKDKAAADAKERADARESTALERKQHIETIDMQRKEMFELIRAERDLARQQFTESNQRWASVVETLTTGIAEHTEASKVVYHQNEVLVANQNLLMSRIDALVRVHEQALPDIKG